MPVPRVAIGFGYTSAGMNGKAVRNLCDELAVALDAARGVAAVDELLDRVAAVRFHAGEHPRRPIVGLFGGTGAGKSTLLNRLAGGSNANLSAASFRRTFTAGPVAVVETQSAIDPDWLGLPHQVVANADLPVRGQPDRLLLVERNAPPFDAFVLVDTPDIDGDMIEHHQLAERVFRWIDRAIFVLTPEKYQLPDLLPFVRLARRYGMPRAFVINKAASREVAADAARRFENDIADAVGGRLFVVPRDDSTMRVESEETIDALRAELISVGEHESNPSANALRLRDLAQRVNDQLIEPLARQRALADDAIERLKSLAVPESDVDVDAMTRELYRRYQKRSVFYLMGPGRMVERLRSAPALVARMPRVAVDFFRGKSADGSADEAGSRDARELPDFPQIAVDQFVRTQSTIAGIISPIDSDDRSWELDPDRAGAIVRDELDRLAKWLEARRDASPRDTRFVETLVKRLPGGKKLAKYSEAAPYLLVIACVTHGAIFGPVDLLVLGGFGVATLLGEKLSNDVAWRTREANRNIARRFAKLVGEQIDAAKAFVAARSPASGVIDRLELAVDRIDESTATVES